MRIIPKPDITFLLDADENIIVQRMNEFDKERPIEDYRKGRKFYLSLVRGKGFYIIDANKDFKEVYNQIISIVMKFL
jgi:thymidylate kinase